MASTSEVIIVITVSTLLATSNITGTNAIVSLPSVTTTSPILTVTSSVGVASVSKIVTVPLDSVLVVFVLSTLPITVNVSVSSTSEVSKISIDT